MTYPWLPGMAVTAERLRGRILAGNVTMIFPGTPNVSTSFYNADYYRTDEVVAFPSGFFEVTPIIQVTARTATPGVLVECSYTAVSTSGVTIVAARHTNTTTIVDWLAIEPTS